MGSRLEEWEAKLEQVFDEIDHHLEDKYGHLYPLHPSRPPRGSTADVQYDGLFNVGAAYTPGFGSVHGEGYVVEVRMVTLARVPDDVRETIEQEVVEMAQAGLPKHFPGKGLKVLRDGRIYKIVGDLDLA